jgi:acyl-CoA thioesterase
VGDLIGLLDVQPGDNGTFIGAPYADEHGRSVVEGSQILGQSIVAASKLVPDRRPVSMWMAFLRIASNAEPVTLALTELSNGRTMSAFAVSVTQGEKLVASGNILLDATATDVIRHEVDSEDVPGPDGSEPFDMAVEGRDIRVVDGAYTGDPNAEVGPPTLDAWVRCRPVPDDPAIHAALLAQFTGHMSIAAALRPHAGIGQDQAHHHLSTAVNAISLSLHSDIRADEWMRYRHHSTFAGDGMTHSECRVHNEEGRLLASFTTDCMVRKFDRPPEAAVKDRL